MAVKLSRAGCEESLKVFLVYDDISETRLDFAKRVPSKSCRCKAQTKPCKVSPGSQQDRCLFGGSRRYEQQNWRLKCNELPTDLRRSQTVSQTKAACSMQRSSRRQVGSLAARNGRRIRKWQATFGKPAGELLETVTEAEAGADTLAGFSESRSRITPTQPLTSPKVLSATSAIRTLQKLAVILVFVCCFILATNGQVPDDTGELNLSKWLNLSKRSKQENNLNSSLKIDDSYNGNQNINHATDTNNEHKYAKLLTPHEQPMVGFRWPIIGLASLIAIGASGNVLVCLAVTFERRLQTATNYFLMSLAIADLLVCTFVMPFGIIYELYGFWPFNWQVCSLWLTSDVLTCSSSIYHMCFISVSRYIGIRNPLHARQAKLFVSRRAVFGRIALAWLLATLVASPVTIMSLVDKENIIPQKRDCAIANKWFLLIGSSLAFFAPMFVMIHSYVMTVRLLSKRAKFAGKHKLLASSNSQGSATSGAGGLGGGVATRNSAGDNDLLAAESVCGSANQTNSEKVLEQQAASRPALVLSAAPAAALATTLGAHLLSAKQTSLKVTQAQDFRLKKSEALSVTESQTLSKNDDTQKQLSCCRQLVARSTSSREVAGMNRANCRGVKVDKEKKKKESEDSSEKKHRCWCNDRRYPRQNNHHHHNHHNHHHHCARIKSQCRARSRACKSVSNCELTRQQKQQSTCEVTITFGAVKAKASKQSQQTNNRLARINSSLIDSKLNKKFACQRSVSAMETGNCKLNPKATNPRLESKRCELICMRSSSISNCNNVDSSVSLKSPKQSPNPSLSPNYLSSSSSITTTNTATATTALTTSNDNNIVDKCRNNSILSKLNSSSSDKQSIILTNNNFLAVSQSTRRRDSSSLKRMRGKKQQPKIQANNNDDNFLAQQNKHKLTKSAPNFVSFGTCNAPSSANTCSKCCCACACCHCCCSCQDVCRSLNRCSSSSVARSCCTSIGRSRRARRSRRAAELGLSHSHIEAASNAPLSQNEENVSKQQQQQHQEVVGKQQQQQHTKKIVTTVPSIMPEPCPSMLLPRPQFEPPTPTNKTSKQQVPQATNKTLPKQATAKTSLNEKRNAPMYSSRQQTTTTTTTTTARLTFSDDDPEMLRYIGSSTQLKNEQKATKVLGVVFFSFVVLWTPFFVINFASGLINLNETTNNTNNNNTNNTSQQQHTDYTKFNNNNSKENNNYDYYKSQIGKWISISQWLGYISSVINPVIYTVFNRNFRLTFRRLLLCKFSKRYSALGTNNRSFRVSQMVAAAAGFQATRRLPDLAAANNTNAMLLPIEGVAASQQQKRNN